MRRNFNHQLFSQKKGKGRMELIISRRSVNQRKQTLEVKKKNNFSEQIYYLPEGLVSSKGLGQLKVDSQAVLSNKGYSYS